MLHWDKHADEWSQICHWFVEKVIDDAVRILHAGAPPRHVAAPAPGDRLPGRSAAHARTAEAADVPAVLSARVAAAASARSDRGAVGGGPSGLDPVLGGKGTLVVYDVYSMHRREEIYGSDAAAFRPERWEDGLRPVEWACLPFGGGSRGCLGQRYAWTEVGYVTVRLAQWFAGLEERDGKPWREELGSTLSSRDGVWVDLRD